MELAEFALRIGAAIIAGLFIGAEREIRDKSAGLKTNALVALGACVFVLASLEFKEQDGVDITRVLSQVVTGIGFIGAGTILQHGKTIKGLTTAATVWCSAGAGCLAAFGLFKELMIVSLLIFIVNFTFSYLEQKFLKKRGGRNRDD